MTPAVHAVNTQTWVNGRHAVRCVKVIQETWDVKTFCFMAEQPVMFFFKPGQFVTLERLYRLPGQRHAQADRPRRYGTRGLLLRPQALYEGSQIPAGTPGLSHGALS
ncbi:hypothetical protein OJHNALOF_00950 [Oceanimonas sp. MB9]|nr:hypothetical protein [Oceanimonas sp. MB9]